MSYRVSAYQPWIMSQRRTDAHVLATADASITEGDPAGGNKTIQLRVRPRPGTVPYAVHVTLTTTNST